MSLPLAVALVLAHRGRFLLIRRGRPPFAGWWSPVTGRVEAGESLAQAARREAQEELGLEIEVGEELLVCPTADGSYELHFLRARWVAGEPRPDPEGVAEWRWFSWQQLLELEPFFRQDLAAFKRLADAPD